MHKACSKGFTATAVDGHVLVEGAQGVAATLTPEAAVASADRIMDEAATAFGQRTMESVQHEVDDQLRQRS